MIIKKMVKHKLLPVNVLSSRWKLLHFLGRMVFNHVFFKEGLFVVRVSDQTQKRSRRGRTGLYRQRACQHVCRLLLTCVPIYKMICYYRRKMISKVRALPPRLYPRYTTRKPIRKPLTIWPITGLGSQWLGGTWPSCDQMRDCFIGCSKRRSVCFFEKKLWRKRM